MINYPFVIPTIVSISIKFFCFILRESFCFIFFNLLREYDEKYGLKISDEKFIELVGIWFNKSKKLNKDHKCIFVVLNPQIYSIQEDGKCIYQ